MTVSQTLIQRHEQLDHRRSARRTWIVLVLTLVFMVIEITAGWLTGSMALLADGWHMGTHAAALGISVLAYRWAARWRDDPRFAYGTGKVPVLGGYTSAIVLLIVAVAMAWESVDRLLRPVEIHFDQALLVAAIGLVVNLVSAVILGGGHDHHGHDHAGHGRDHDHDHAGHDHQPAAPRLDHGLRAAYIHVLADALTSVLAIIALLAGRYWGWAWLDPAIGIVGGLVIARWALGLIRDTGPRLIDRVDSTDLHERIRARLAGIEGAQIEDLHVWPCGSHGHAVLIRLRADRDAESIHELLRDLPCDHLTVEIARP